MKVYILKGEDGYYYFSRNLTGDAYYGESSNEDTAFNVVQKLNEEKFRQERRRYSGKADLVTDEKEQGERS